MSIQTELTRLTNAKSAIKAAIEGRGVTVPDATLLDGMAALIDSIEAGGGGDIGGLNLVSGTWTPAEDTTTCRITGLDGSPTACLLAPAFSSDEATNGVAKMLAAIWFRGVYTIIRTSTTGTTIITDTVSALTYDNFVIQDDDYAIGSGKVEVLQTGFAICRAGYYFRAGLTYNWAAIV